VISFARGVPAPECLPVEELAECARAVLLADGRTILSYGSPSGYEPLRGWIAERHSVEPDRVFVTNGGLQGFVFFAQRFGRDGLASSSSSRPTTVL
jgi:DNA-binding transcriptional MocR family regulator